MAGLRASNRINRRRSIVRYPSFSLLRPGRVSCVVLLVINVVRSYDLVVA